MPKVFIWGPVGGQERHAPHVALTTDTPQELIGHTFGNNNCCKNFKGEISPLNPLFIVKGINS